MKFSSDFNKQDPITKGVYIISAIGFLICFAVVFH